MKQLGCCKSQCAKLCWSLASSVLKSEGSTFSKCVTLNLPSDFTLEEKDLVYLENSKLSIYRMSWYELTVTDRERLKQQTNEEDDRS